MHRNKNKNLLASMTLLISFCAITKNVVAIDQWPGESSENATSLSYLSDDFDDGDISGAHWNNETRTLWVSDNKEEKIFSLIENGSNFRIDKSFEVLGDLEGITQALDNNILYVIDEDTFKIRAYSANNGSSSGLGVWDIANDIAEDDDGHGPEGITFVPDEWLDKLNFTDNSGSRFRSSQNGLGGIFFIAHQNGGALYAFDLAANGSYDFIGEYETGRDESSGLEFDRSTGALYISHNTDGNSLEISNLDSAPSGDHRVLDTLAHFEAPNNSNLEGFAIASSIDSNSQATSAWVFYTDDDGDDGAILWFKDLKPSMSITHGNNQTGFAGETLTTKPSVKITDRFANAIPNLHVDFSIASGDGFISEPETITNTFGEAVAGSWELGLSGNQALTAESGSLSVSFNAEFIEQGGTTGGDSGGETDGGSSGTDGGDDGGESFLNIEASSHDGNTPLNAIDNNLGTRWSASGNGQWLELSFGGNTKNISGVDIAFFKGNLRSAFFDIQTSNDGTSWTSQLEGMTSSGLTTDLESFDFSETVSCQYVRYVGYGNNSSSSSSAAWNSITEFSAFETAIIERPEEVNAEKITDIEVSNISGQQDSNPASNLYDGDASNNSGARWSSPGLASDSQFVILDLGASYKITGSVLTPYKGRDYQYLIQLSVNPSSGFSTIVDRSEVNSGATLKDIVTSNTAGRYLRLEILGANSYSGDWASINELELMGIKQ